MEHCRVFFSKDVFMPGMVQRYIRRHFRMRHISLAEFGTFYNYKRSNSDQVKDYDADYDDDDEEGWAREECDGMLFFVFIHMYILLWSQLVGMVMCRIVNKIKYKRVNFDFRRRIGFVRQWG